MEIQYNLLAESECVPHLPKKLDFGKIHTPHMFLMNYNLEEGWHNSRIVPYREGINLPLGAKILNYGQGIFEGEKVHQHPDGELYLFRPELNIARLNHSARRIRIPEVPPEIQLEARVALVDVDRLWFPQQDDASLYARPVVFGISDALGLEPSEEYIFGIFLSPSGSYFDDGPIKIMVTDKFHRAAPGGTGSAKFLGNYPGTFLPTEIAKRMGAAQVLYLDVTNKWIDEYGAMFHFQVSDDLIEIPQFTDTNLHSTTAQTFVDLRDRFDFTITQKTISLEEFLEGLRSGRITEAGGLGTAAVVSSVGEYLLDLGETEYHYLETITVGNGSAGPVATNMRAYLRGMQRGIIEAPQGWLHHVSRRL